MRVRVRDEGELGAGSVCMTQMLHEISTTAQRETPVSLLTAAGLPAVVELGEELPLDLGDVG